MRELGFYRRLATERDHNWCSFCKARNKEADGIHLGRREGQWLYMTFDNTRHWMLDFFEFVPVPKGNSLEDYL